MSHYIKNAMEYLGFSTTVGKDMFFNRKTYRPAGQSAPRPNLTQNYPIKEEKISDQTYSTMKLSLEKAAFNVRSIRISKNPRFDFRNKNNHRAYLRNSVPMTRRLIWDQISEEDEAQR